MLTPTVSILTPVYNAAPYLEQLVTSVAEQQGSERIEHVLIDDGSTDGSVAVLDGLRWGGIRVRSRENQGQYRTHNELLGMARGNFVLFIAADDYLDSDQAIAHLLGVQRRRDHDVVVGRTRLTYDRYEGLSFVQIPGPRLSTRLLPGAIFLHHCAVLVRRQVLVEHDVGFRDCFSHAADWDWLLRLREVVPNERWAYTRHVIASKRVHEGQISHRDGGWENLRSRRSVLTDRGRSPRWNDTARTILGTANRAKLFGIHARHRGVTAAFRKVHEYFATGDPHDTSDR